MRTTGTRRYAAFLRGVYPTNCAMADLKRCFESAGFTNVATILGSGNVAFDARPTTEEALAKKAEGATERRLGTRFFWSSDPTE